MPEDVQPADPSNAVAPEASVDQDAGSVPGDVAPVSGDDRPVQNVVAEFNRKFAKLQQQQDALMQYVALQGQQSRTPAQTKGDPTQDELWSLAQQGDRGAYDLYMRRIATEAGQAQVQAMQYTQLVDSQLGILMGRYPVLNDASHPLTQQVNATYQALMTRGYSATRATLLEAVKTAIADRPDLVSEFYQKAAPATLRRDRAQAGVTGTTIRESSSAPAAKPPSAAEAALARRMGVKDPSGAKTRFQQRQNSGQSAVADTLHPFIREE